MDLVWKQQIYEYGWIEINESYLEHGLFRKSIPTADSNVLDLTPDHS